MGVTWTAHYWIGVSFVLLVISVMVSELQIIGPHFIHWPNWKSKVVLHLVQLQFENRQLLFIFITYDTGHYKGDIGNSRLYCIVGSWLPQICINDKSNAIFSVSEKGHTLMDLSGQFSWISAAASTELEIQVGNTLRGILANLLKLYIHINFATFSCSSLFSFYYQPKELTRSIHSLKKIFVKVPKCFFLLIYCGTIPFDLTQL